MDWELLFDKIGLCEIGRECFYRIDKRREKESFVLALEKSKEKFYEGRKLFSEYVETFAENEQIPEASLVFYICACLLQNLREEYQKRGIDDSVFYDTMQALPVLCRTGYEEKGIYGVLRRHHYWVRYFYLCKIFRLGSLQFELCQNDAAVEFGDVKLAEGQSCIEVHIPKGSNLQEQACEEAYAAARDFFKKHFGIETCVFFCGSWLLHPWISECLGSGSRIVQFQKKFKLIEVTEDPLQVIFWVFGKKMDDVNDYPEDNSLRRAAKERLIKGLPLGVARGIRL